HGHAARRRLLPGDVPPAEQHEQRRVPGMPPPRARARDRDERPRARLRDPTVVARPRQADPCPRSPDALRAALVLARLDGPLDPGPPPDPAPGADPVAEPEAPAPGRAADHE